MKKRILVTGAAGNIGSKVVQDMVNLDKPVRAGIHSMEKAHLLAETGAETVHIDFFDTNSIKSALDGIDKIFLVTPFSPKMHEMVKNVVNVAKKSGIEHIVRLSVMGADWNSKENLIKYHQKCEEIIEKSGIPWTHIRPNSFMQNFSNYHSDSIINKNQFYQPLADSRVSYIDSRDIAEVASKILADGRHKGNAYTLTGPEALDHHEIAEIFSQITGRQIQYVDVSMEDAKKGMLSMGMPEWMAEDMLGLMRLMKEGKYSEVTDDVHKMLKRDPISFRQYAADYGYAFSKTPERERTPVGVF